MMMANALLQEKQWSRELQVPAQPQEELAPHEDETSVTEDKASQERSIAARLASLRLGARKAQEASGEAAGAATEDIRDIFDDVTSVSELFDVIEAATVVGIIDLWARWNYRWWNTRVFNGALSFLPFASLNKPLKRWQEALLMLVNFFLLIALFFAVVVILLIVDPCLFTDIIDVPGFNWLKPLVSAVCSIATK